MMTGDKTETSKSYDTIKLGIDAHAKWYCVARQLDGATPQPVQDPVLGPYGHSERPDTLWALPTLPRRRGPPD
jgi:hypothetical protein